MKRFIARFGIAFGFMFVAACGPSPVPRDEAQKDLVQVQQTEIRIDKDLSGSAVSTNRNFYFIVDGSGSMDDAPGGECIGDRSFGKKIDGAKWALGQFIDKVPVQGVNLGLYVFDYNTEDEVVSLGSNNRDVFLRAVDEIGAGGGTPLAHAIRVGTDKLVAQYKQQLGYGEYRLVVVTDGQANDLPEAAKYAAQYGIPINTIGLCIGEDHPLRTYSVSYRAADNFKDLARGLEETLAELPNFDATEFNPQGSQDSAAAPRE